MISIYTKRLRNNNAKLRLVHLDQSSMPLSIMHRPKPFVSPMRARLVMMISTALTLGVTRKQSLHGADLVLH
jgi:hypothetical protein